MILREEGLHLKGGNMEIPASDISDNVLKAAAAGVYEKYSLRNTPEQYLKKYFSGQGESYTISRKAQDLVRFRKINLMESLETRLIKGMDVVFCRNVLIYFDVSSKYMR